MLADVGRTPWFIVRKILPSQNTGTAKLGRSPTLFQVHTTEADGPRTVISFVLVHLLQNNRYCTNPCLIFITTVDYVPVSRAYLCIFVLYYIFISV